MRCGFELGGRSGSCDRRRELVDRPGLCGHRGRSLSVFLFLLRLMTYINLLRAISDA